MCTRGIYIKDNDDGRRSCVLYIDGIHGVHGPGVIMGISLNLVNLYIVSWCLSESKNNNVKPKKQKQKEKTIRVLCAVSCAVCHCFVLGAKNSIHVRRYGSIF